MKIGAVLVVLALALIGSAQAQTYPDVGTCTNHTGWPFDPTPVFVEAVKVLLNPPVGILSQNCSLLAIASLQICAPELYYQDGCCSPSCANPLQRMIDTYDPTYNASCYSELVSAICNNTRTNQTSVALRLQTALYRTSYRCTGRNPTCPGTGFPPPAVARPPPKKRTHKPPPCKMHKVPKTHKCSPPPRSNLRGRFGL